MLLHFFIKEFPIRAEKVGYLLVVRFQLGFKGVSIKMMRR
jgi:hypothetical protein